MSKNIRMDDLRSVKSVENIYDTFLDLMAKKDFSKISVTLICETAKISRSTFYDHFEDKYDLLKCILRDITHDLTRGNSNTEELHSPAAYFMFSLREKYMMLLKEILLSPENYGLFQIYSDLIQQDLKYQICTKNQISENASWLDLVSTFYSGALLSVLRLLCSGKSVHSQNELDQYFQILMNHMHEDSMQLAKNP